ncbi:MAG: nucleotidyltransferase family protein [Eubacterium sp.]
MSVKNNSKLLEKQIMTNAGYDMIFLVKCALHNIKPDTEWIKNYDLHNLHKMCKFHGLTAIVYTVLESAGINSGKADALTLLETWKSEKEKALYKTVLMDIEREHIFEFMEKKGIWHVPLKGIILKELYPREEMREMSDNDIYYDKTYQKELYAFMTERGYEPSQIGTSHHEVYKKQPVYNFEMHTSVFGSKQNKIWIEYYQDIEKRFIKDKEGSYGYHFSDEDFYIQIMAHMYKHYVEGGTGIRSLVDCYVFLKKKEDSLDWDKLKKELTTFGIADFEMKIRVLSKKIFENTDKKVCHNLTEEEKEMLDYLLFSGAMGTRENKIANDLKSVECSNEKIKRKAKLKYFFKRIFPEMEFLKMNYPIAYKYKFLIPFVYIFRILKGIFIKPQKLLKEFIIVWKKKK